MSDDIAIKVDNASKTFRLPHEKNNSIKSMVINFYRSNRTYEKQEALRDVSFEVKKGEFFGIVGRNGSGKSTLLKMLAGIYSPSKGNITVNGKLTPFIELGVGFNPELTGRENVYLNGALLGFNRKEMRKMYRDIVEFAELRKFMDQKLKNYSSGMQVRLAFSIAIRAKNAILLLDEVLAVGDAAFQKKCYDYFMSLKKEKRTVILVTHDMSAVRQYCNRAMMIDNGSVVATGSPESIAQSYQKLFTLEMSKDKSSKTDTKSQRWGTGKMAAAKVSTKLNKDKLTLDCEFIAKENLPAPILGFSIYGSAGNNILEGNTFRQGYKTSDMKKGGKERIIWEIPNIFADGEYYISIACCDQSATEYYDWLNDASSFTIHKGTTTAGIVDPPLTIEKAN